MALCDINDWKMLTKPELFNHLGLDTQRFIEEVSEILGMNYHTNIIVERKGRRRLSRIEVSAAGCLTSHGDYFFLEAESYCDYNGCYPSFQSVRDYSKVPCVHVNLIPNLQRCEPFLTRDSKR